MNKIPRRQKKVMILYSNLIESIRLLENSLEDIRLNNFMKYIYKVFVFSVNYILIVI